MPTSNQRRHDIDVLRSKATTAADKLDLALDEDEHDEDCVLRCLMRDCRQLHSCPVCRVDGEV